MALLEVSKVDFQYYGSSFGLQDVNLSLNESDRLVIYGRENSGKTTLLRLLCGLEEYCRGSILLDDAELNQLSQKDMNIGFSFDSRILDGKSSVEDVISYPMKLRNLQSEDIVDYLNSVSDRCNLPMQSQINNLSEMQVAMVIIARLFAVDRRMYLVDDVWKDLPQEEKTIVIDFLKEKIADKSVIVATDDSAMAKQISTDRIVVLSDSEALNMMSMEDIVSRPLNMQSAIFAGYELHIGQLIKIDGQCFAEICGNVYPVNPPIGDVYVGKRVCFAVRREGEPCETEEVGDATVMSFYYDIDNERIISKQ
ncbi:MAG: ATP-binding cassette domain-containing protein [Clostridia bacterium]|nr:ATP-binding cassette domain-containing protein [Clostridia bacterium]